MGPRTCSGLWTRAMCPALRRYATLTLRAGPVADSTTLGARATSRHSLVSNVTSPHQQKFYISPASLCLHEERIHISQPSSLSTNPRVCVLRFERCVVSCAWSERFGASLAAPERRKLWLVPVTYWTSDALPSVDDAVASFRPVPRRVTDDLIAGPQLSHHSTPTKPAFLLSVPNYQASSNLLTPFPRNQVSGLTL
jgi:hypothetical protein